MRGFGIAGLSGFVDSFCFRLFYNTLKASYLLVLLRNTACLFPWINLVLWFRFLNLTVTSPKFMENWEHVMIFWKVMKRNAKLFSKWMQNCAKLIRTRKANWKRANVMSQVKFVYVYILWSHLVLSVTSDRWLNGPDNGVIYSIWNIIYNSHSHSDGTRNTWRDCAGFKRSKIDCLQLKGKLPGAAI